MLGVTPLKHFSEYSGLPVPPPVRGRTPVLTPTRGGGGGGGGVEGGVGGDAVGEGGSGLQMAGGESRLGAAIGIP